jgi:CRP-like cAMP-binding protein
MILRVKYSRGCPSPRATEMKNRQPIRECQKPLAFLAEAPLGWLMPHAAISNIPSGSTVCVDGQNAEWAYLILSGSCEQRLNLPDGELKVLRAFKRGETFGGFLLQDTMVVASEDSAVLRIRLRDLADIAPKTDDKRFCDSPKTSDTTRFTFRLNAPKGKIITLAFFSALLPEKSLAENIARQLRSETGSSVALVRLVASADEDLDCDLNCKFILQDELRETEADFHLLRVGVTSEQFDPKVLGELFRTLRFRAREYPGNFHEQHPRRASQDGRGQRPAGERPPAAGDLRRPLAGLSQPRLIHSCGTGNRAATARRNQSTGSRKRNVL